MRRKRYFNLYGMECEYNDCWTLEMTRLLVCIIPGMEISPRRLEIPKLGEKVFVCVDPLRTVLKSQTADDSACRAQQTLSSCGIRPHSQRV